MNKITFICCPKPFTSDFYDIQNNAIMSWSKLKCVDKIIICGNDNGIESYVNQLMTQIDKLNVEIIYIKDIVVNEFGTPLINNLFDIAAQNTEKYACYINSDIILLSDFDNTFQAFATINGNQKNCLLVGQRWDWNRPEQIDFTNSNWQDILKKKALLDGSMHAKTGIDYFVHTKTTFPNMVPFAIGRFWWDNWIVGNAFSRKNEVMTVDVTNTVFAIHQNSPWMMDGKLQNNIHVLYNGPESVKNRSYPGEGRDIKSGSRYISQIGDNETITFTMK